MTSYITYTTIYIYYPIIGFTLDPRAEPVGMPGCWLLHLFGKRESSLSDSEAKNTNAKFRPPGFIFPLHLYKPTNRPIGRSISESINYHIEFILI